jgi:hypothetical protein
MPEKLPRKRDANAAPSIGLTVPDAETALVLGFAHVTHGATLAAGEAASATVTAAGQVLGTSIKTFGECFTSFMGYMKEREITKRVVAQEMAATHRVQIWSHTVIAEAEERTEQVRISASLVLASINDKAKQRDAKLEVIQGFMVAYKDWNKMLTTALASRADRMPLDERELLQQHIQTLLQRAREMENCITTIAVTL